MSPARRFAVAAFLLTLAAVRTSAQTPPLVMTSEKLSEGLWVISGFTNGNILAIRGDDGLLLIDAQSEKRVALADSVLRTLDQSPVRAVVSTHYHNDHVGGNAYWHDKGALIVSARNVLSRSQRDTTITALAEEYGTWVHKPEPTASLPTLLFDDSLTWRAGNDTVRVMRLIPSHTDGDVIVYLPIANVMHTGDILEIGAPPFIDLFAGGSLDGMIAGVDTILARTNERTRYVPGHGPVVNRARVVEYRAMLADMREQMRAGIAEGWNRDAMDRARPFAKWERDLGSTRATRRFERLVFYSLSRASRVTAP
jgi:cyclase